MGSAMQECRSTRVTVLAATLTAACVLAGCTPSRQEVYDDINAVHVRAHQRWLAEGGLRDDLPRLKGDLHLVDAVKVALQHNPGLNEVLAERMKSRGLVLESYSEALPHLDATLGATLTEGVNNNTLRSYSAGLTVTQTLYKGGAVGAGLRAARLFSYLSDERVRGQIQTVAYDVAQLYWTYRLASQLSAVQKAGLDSAERQLEDVEAKVKQGLATEFDRLRAQVEVANFRTAVVQQRNRMRLAMVQLLRVMGASQRSEARPVDALTYEPMKMGYEEAVGIAGRNRPDIYQAELEVRLQKEALKVLRSGYLPSASATFGNSWARPHPASGKDHWGGQWSAGVTVTWPIFDGLRTKGQMVQQRAEVLQSQIRQSDTAQRLLLEVKQGLLDLEDSQELVETQALNQKSAQLALELAEIGKEAGVRTDLQVVDARTALVRAQGLYFEALFSHAVARMDLERALGLLAPEPGTVDKSPTVPVPGRFSRLPKEPAAADVTPSVPGATPGE